MHRVRFRDPAGAVRMGEWNDESVHFGRGSYTLDEVDILPPSAPSKIVCIGLNYTAHAEESGEEIPDRPLLFLKGPNAVAGHGDTIPLLAGKDRIDYEAELGVVIGEQCRNVSRERAMDVVEGFTCVNDVSNRDDQFDERNWIRGKAFDGAAPIGPVVAGPDEVPADASVRARVNGELRQEGTRDDLIFPVPELIEEITTYLTLESGDVIATGTPAGVGPLSDGDTVEIEVEGIGKLTNTVATE
ncbi:2-hydroxyhepta-2,4-diene-1,7-dioate isomerase [Natrinema sp. CBA1119]|uniref:fumarylacetoacetate hydrolase family protein n=1 Tax=Natrinema sp. CBA1119 TaxID=1608465 RepID=UPI000BF82693|nr:fumarylacetoacetate hydrolase family protein [Natrinema sp. CBA1119]PGF13836.1 2-hydroxyhepta-2,4-diene-1,7-dioate isomerase [Natrinema sp. CBA1119]